MRNLFKTLYGVILFMSMLCVFTACEDKSDVNKNRTEEGIIGKKISYSEDGITVTVTEAEKSGDNFFDIKFNAVNTETPKRTHDREVIFTITATDGTVYSENASILGKSFEYGNTYSGRALIRVDAQKKLDKKTITIVSIKPI